MAVSIVFLSFAVLFTAVSGQFIFDYGSDCSYFHNDTMSTSIYVTTSTPIEKLYFTNPLTLENETIQYDRKESLSYATYTNNSFFTAKRGPLKSAHMKYIPVYQQTADGTDLVTTVDFCLTSISYKAALAIAILVPLFIIICCITACILIGICICKMMRRNKYSPLN